MAFKVGIPCMKCSLNPSQQKNAQTGKSSKTCSVKAAWEEMNDERRGLDTTIDKTMTDRNVWMIGSSEDDVVKMVQDEIADINMDRKANGKRSLRKDAVSVVSIVEKPPISYMENLTYEERIQFLNDSHEVMAALIADWNQNWKIIEAVQHHDEFGGLSPHNHTLIMITSEDENGVKMMNAKKEFGKKFFSHINKNYAEQMRLKGYDVEDCRTFDSLSDEEKEYRRLHPEEHGVAAYRYKQQKQHEAEEQIKLSEEKIAEMKEEIGDLKQLAEEKKKFEQEKGIVADQKADYEEKLLALTSAPSVESYEQLNKENKLLKTELSIKDRLVSQLSAEKEYFQELAEAWKNRFIDVAHKIGNKLMTALGYDLSEEKGMREYPSTEMAGGIRDMQQQFGDGKAKGYRVIPDDHEKDAFRVVVKQSEGYTTIQGGFSSRREAESYRKEIAEANRSMSLDLDEPSLKM